MVKYPVNQVKPLRKHITRLKIVLTSLDPLVFVCLYCALPFVHLCFQFNAVNNDVTNVKTDPPSPVLLMHCFNFDMFVIHTLEYAYVTYLMQSTVDVSV